MIGIIVYNKGGKTFNSTSSVFDIIHTRSFTSIEKERVLKVDEFLRKLQETALHNENTFDALMEASKYCTLGQITHAMFEVAGQYRRNM